LISHEFWQTRFGGSPDAIWTSIELDGRTSKVNGIPPACFGLEQLAADLWEPPTVLPENPPLQPVLVVRKSAPDPVDSGVHGFQTSLLVGFAFVALLLSAIGIYGLIQHSIATRLAIGAHAGEIFRLVMGEGLKLSLAGLGLGLIGALWLDRAGASLLFGVTATDPLTFLSLSILLTAVALAACCFPARRSMKVDPIVVLRQD